MNSTVPAPDVADGARRRDRGLAHGLAQFLRHARRRRLLDHLLVPPLQRAVALVEMNDVAASGRRKSAARYDAATVDELFDQHARIAECRLPFALSAFKRVVEIRVPVDAVHALAAAAGDRLDQHRVADLVGFLLEKGRAPGARRDSPAAPRRRPAPSASWRGPSAPWRGSLPAADRRRRCRLARSAPRNPRFRRGTRSPDGCRLRCVCCAIARMVSPLQVALRRGRGTDQVRFVANARVQRLRVRRRIDRNRAQPEPFGGACDAHRDLAAVGNENGRKHG